MMREALLRIRDLWARRPARLMRVRCVQPLSSGVTLYAIDIDGRRLLIGASARSICVLDRYPVPACQQTAQREPVLAAPNL